MNKVLFLIMILFFQYSFAEVSDAEVVCHNLKGEVIITSFFRLDKSSVQVFEKAGGFAFSGQSLVTRTARAGVLGLIHVECGADLNSETDVSLVTCASGSQIRFLNKVLPSIRTGCR